jgi:hypothetical protein
MNERVVIYFLADGKIRSREVMPKLLERFLAHMERITPGFSKRIVRVSFP